MLIRIIAKNPGCVFDIGQLIRVGDVQGAQIISQGYGEMVGESEVQKPVEGPKLRARDNPFMQPPRFLCRCGWVAKSEEELKSHKCD